MCTTKHSSKYSTHYWVSGMVCTVLCLCKRVCVCVYGQTQTGIMHNASTHKYMTPFKTLWRELLIDALSRVQNVIGIISKSCWSRSQTFHNTFQYLPLTFMYMLKTVFLILFIAIDVSLTIYRYLSRSSLSLWSHGTCAPTLPKPRPSLLQKKLHLSKVLLLLSTLV